MVTSPPVGHRLRTLTVTDLDWSIVEIPREVEEAGKAIIAEQDRQARKWGSQHRFWVRNTDWRWVGPVGELGFMLWLERLGVPYRWNNGGVPGKPDFHIGGHSIDVKTVKRKGGVLPDHTAQITADHVDEEVDQFFFASYEYTNRRLWLLGGISRSDFRREARYVEAGEAVHKDYTVRSDHAIFNIEVTRLIRPYEWVDTLL